METEALDGERVQLLTDVGEEADRWEPWVNNRVGELSGDLTGLLNDILERRDDGEVFSETELQAMSIDLAGQMYTVGSRLEKWGIRVDAAERARKAAFARGMTGGKGGREEKAEWGVMASLPQEEVANIHSRVYWLVKRQLDEAHEMIMSLKKSLGYRAEELSVFRAEMGGKGTGREVD